jgi:hypothetical protein
LVQATILDGNNEIIWLPFSHFNDGFHLI